jgi:hypothetical protein
MAHDLDSVGAALVNSRSRLLPQTNDVETGVRYMFTRGRKTDELSIVSQSSAGEGEASVNVRPVMAAAFPPQLPALRLGAAGSRPD